MRVLVVTNMYPAPKSPRRGVFVQREVEALRGVGHEVLVVHIDTAAARYRYLTGWRRVAEAFASFEPDIVHVHYGLSLAFLPRVRGVPVVCTFHGSDLAVRWQRLITRALLNRVDAAIVVAGWMTGMLSDRVASVTVVPCAVAFEGPCPSREAARSALGLSGGTNLLFPSSPRRPGKRYPLFLDTVRAVPGAIPIALDEIRPEEVPLWLAASDCVVMTSSSEGSPVITKEALVCGTRVVSVDVGDMAEQLRGFSGCEIAAPDSVALASAVVRCLGSPGPDSDVARARFGMAREIEGVCSVYRSVVGRDVRA